MNNFQLGKLFGIPLELNTSWILIFLLVTWSLASGVYPSELPGFDPIVYWLMALFSAAIYFLGIIAHEFGHALVAKAIGIKVRRIALFMFGGVAEIESNPKSGLGEVLVAIAGPLVSIALAGLFWLLIPVGGVVGEVAKWLANINLLVTLFNLLPGFPLDGGRVVRGLIWALTKSFERATKIAATLGILVAWGLIGFGIFQMFRGNLFGGIWLVLIAMFLQNAANAEIAQLSFNQMQKTLANYSVRQLMQTDWPTILPSTNLAKISEMILTSGRRAYPVVAEDGRFFGLVTVHSLQTKPREQWPFLQAEAALVPELQFIEAEMPAMQALEIMAKSDIHQLPVLTRDPNNWGRMYLGMISRDQLIALVQLKGQNNA